MRTFKSFLAESAAPDIHITDHIRSAMRDDTSKSPHVHSITADMAGVIPRRPSALDFDVSKNYVNLQHVKDGWQSSRDAIKAHHGDHVTLYRAEAPEEDHIPETKTLRYADKEFAHMFADGTSRKVVARKVHVDDIIAAYHHPKANYHEFIVPK